MAQQDSLVHQNWKRDPNANVTSTVSNQKQIITKEQILHSGYALLSDVFQLIDGWTMSTWNGDRWNMVSNGVGSYQQQNWVLMLDGVKTDLMKLDGPNINTIGISVFDIERIEVINVVGNYLGVFNDRGIIHIITKRNDTGFTYRAFISNGNETGDPHLNAINNLNLNVHEYGTVVANYIGFKRKNWNIQVSQYANNYFYRDTTQLIYPLVSQYNAKPDMFNTMFNGRLLASYTTQKSTHQLTFNINQADDVILPSGIFKPITGRNDFYQAGYVLRYVLNKGILQYRGSFTNRSFKGDFHQIITHKQQYQSHHLNYTTAKNMRNGSNIKQYGIDVTQATTSLNQMNENKFTDYLIRPYYSLTYPLTAKSSLFTDVSLATNFNDFLPKLSLGYYKQPTILTNWSFVASFSQRNQFENNSYPYLLSLNDTLGTDLSDEAASLTTLDYFFNINASKYFKVGFNSGLKSLNNDLLFASTFGQPILPLILSTTLQPRHQTRWVNRINFHYDMFRGTRIDINYLFINLLTDKSDLNYTIPKHKFTLVISQTLPSRFYLWARFYYQSRTTSSSPAFINQSSANILFPYGPLNQIRTLDLGVTKKLLKEYAIVNLSVRNIFNSVEQYQSNGAAFSLRLFLSLRINIQ